ncbi:Coq4 family protein [Thermocoleostomius sinensis]|uniref:Coq4 family protein n=1 Tax=Thermocoleostomius sinensis A174 TaxID=2016057 RepID=A0A9E8Z8E5_9CYAN|nr:Coq4 family protein [Thermocoleostomius sinensis]WAL58390.1 Coq4 family protein [Thermocoleostomius sinensis A174]
MIEQNATMRKELLTGLQGFMAFVKNPGDTESVFDIAEAMGQTEAQAAAMEYLKSIPEVAQIIAERYIAPTPNLQKLLALPTDSLGYVYSSHLTEANFDPEFYRKVVIQDDFTYIALRMRQTHDIWHTVTGFGVDVMGEIGLQAFQLAQNRSPLAVMLMAGALLSTIRTSGNLNTLMQVMDRGYRMGVQAKPFLAQKWEEAWDKPLATWRSELTVEAINA